MQYVPADEIINVGRLQMWVQFKVRWGMMWIEVDNKIMCTGRKAGLQSVDMKM